MRRGVGWGGAAVVLAAGCEQPRTELVVRVDSEVAWGEGQAAQSVVLTVRRGGATGPLRSARTTALGAGDGRRALPLYVGVIAADDDNTPVWIEALGCGDHNGCTAATAVVAQRAVVRFTRGRTEEVPMLLASACVGVTCASDQRCTTGGVCEIATRAQEMVRPYTGATDAAVALDATVDARGDVAPVDAADAMVRDGSASLDVEDARDAPGAADAVEETHELDAVGSDVVTMVDTPLDAEVSADALGDLGARTDVTKVDVVPAIDAGGLECASGRTLCGVTCRDVTSDPSHCGACNLACPAGQVCVASGCSSTALYHGWTSPVPGCSTASYDTTAATALGGRYPYNTGDSAACRAWKLAATVCTTQPVPYSGNENFSCPQSGGFTDPTFGTYCTVASQYSCSTCPGACNAGACRSNSNTLRNCSGAETSQP